MEQTFEYLIGPLPIAVIYNKFMTPHNANVELLTHPRVFWDTSPSEKKMTAPFGTLSKFQITNRPKW